MWQIISAAFDLGLSINQAEWANLATAFGLVLIAAPTIILTAR